MTSSKRHLNIRMRLLDDGGPLFALMASIPEAGQRDELLLQLAYQGLMVEKGAVGLVLGTPQNISSANAALFNSQETPSGKRTQRKEKP